MTRSTRPCCDIVVTVLDRAGAAPRVYTVRCDPPGGDHPDPAGACALLHSDADLFSPVPAGTMDTVTFCSVRKVPGDCGVTEPSPSIRRKNTVSGIGVARSEIVRRNPSFPFVMLPTTSRRSSTSALGVR